MVDGILRFGDMVYFFLGVWAMSCACACACCLGGLGLLGAAADLELPMAGSW
jgi:hypothetical protein